MDAIAKAKNQIRVPPNLQDAFDRTVVAGMKVLFSKETNSFINEGLQQDKPLADKLSGGVIKLMQMLFEQSKGKMPGEIVIPAGIFLLLEMLDYVQQLGMEVTPEDVVDANKKTLFGLMQAFGGVSPDKVLGAFEQMQKQGMPQRA